MTKVPESLRLKHGWPFPDSKNKLSLQFTAKSSLVVPIFGTISKIWLCWLNKVSIHNASTLHSLIEDRPAGQPLITISNHDCCLDDPLLYGILRWRSALSYSHMRWTLAAHDIVFTTRIGSWFFSLCKAVPVIRGLGVNQRALDFCADRLREGSWVHIFPEGKVNTEKEHLRLKWGVGRLVYDCWKEEYETNNTELVSSNTFKLDELNTSIDRFLKNKMMKDNGSNPQIVYEDNKDIPLREVTSRVPIVLPIYHCGLDSVLPNKKPYIPLVGKKVTVLVGNPIYLDKILAQIDYMKIDRVHARKIITDYIQRDFYQLKLRAKRIHSLENTS